jgi:O-antigen ligase
VGLVLALFLGISIAVSGAPALTAFKVYQLLATVLFASMFVHLYGVDRCLEALFWSSAILCAADAIAAFVAPDLVFVRSEVGGFRFRGDLIAHTGVVSVFALILFLTRARTARRLATGVCVVLFGGVLVLSLMRTAYLALAVVALLAWITQPHVRRLRQFSYVIIILIPLLMGIRAVSVLDEYRPAESMWSLSDRTGLWTHLVNVTWQNSPLFGLGYFAASRIYAPQYNPDLGTAHSGFVEVFVGGGVPSALAYIAIWCALVVYVLPLVGRGMDRRSFAVLALLTSTFLFTFIGGAVEAEPVGTMFWCLAAIIPVLWREHQRRRARQPALLHPVSA